MFFWYQTGLTQMADTVIGGSVGLGLSGGQVSCDNWKIDALVYLKWILYLAVSLLHLMICTSLFKSMALQVKKQMISNKTLVKRVHQLIKEQVFQFQMPRRSLKDQQCPCRRNKVKMFMIKKTRSLQSSYSTRKLNSNCRFLERLPDLASDVLYWP